MRSILERVLLLPSTLLALSLSHALASGATKDNANSNTTPTPISVAPSEQWDGIDGSWSSFNVEIGTPPQEVRSFVSWTSYQTWGVVPEGCSSAENYNACAQSRGGIFNYTASRTFDEEGIFLLWIEQNLGYDGNGVYGFDTVSIGGDNGPTLKNTTVSGYALEDFYVAVFGINPKPTNFSSYSNGAPSYMTLLKEQDYIPSVSFGYTAGANYRSNSSSDAFASLTLGGFDTSKFVDNDLEWSFAENNDRDIVVALHSINTPSDIKSSPVPTELLPDHIYVYLDSTVPQIWLPIESCYVFEYEFGLTYDNTTQLYLVNNTLHQQLLARNASITFQLATDLHDENTISIELPYAAFDLTAQATYQGLENDTYYFPLRRAANESQYTIGRTFFQEAYITVDYESQKFNVSQRLWDNSADKNIVTIPPYSSKSTYPGAGGSSNGSGSSLSGGAIAGIVVGAVVILAILAALFIWLKRRRSKRADKEHEKLGSDAGSDSSAAPPPRGQEDTVFPKAELPGSMPPQPQPELEDSELLASGALSSNDSSSPSRNNHHSGSTYGQWRNASYSPTTPSTEAGTGTHSSNEHSSHGTGTAMSGLVSPISVTGSHEADSKERHIHEMAGSKERHIFEMAGDMPTVKEKDGKLLSEKEALAHREKMYNGVDSSSGTESPEHAATQRERPSRVDPDEVQIVRSKNLDVGSANEQRDTGRHRAFSFEEKKAEGEGSVEKKTPSGGSNEELYE